MTLLHQTEIVPLSRILIQAVLAFALAMIVTPIYTHLAFKYKWWKQMRTDAIDGQKAPIYAKLHAAKHKRNIPTMGGLMMIIPVALVTILSNLSRSQTLLPLTVLLAAGIVGLFDDWLNIRSGGLGIAGMRGKIKFSLILGIAVVGAWYFFAKLGYSSIHVPAVGDEARSDRRLWAV